jgi:hypothetical protein
VSDAEVAFFLMHFGDRFPRGYRNIASTRRGAKGKPNRGLPISSTKNHSAISQGMKKVEARGTTLEVRRSATKERKWAVVLSNDEEDVSPVEILPKSTHRDGSLYNTSTHVWKRNYQVADRSESKCSISLFLFVCLFVMSTIFKL